MRKPPPGPTRSFMCRTCRNGCSRSWSRCRCSCWPIMSPCSAAATWTSRGTWPRASRWSEEKKIADCRSKSQEVFSACNLQSLLGGFVPSSVHWCRTRPFQPALLHQLIPNRLREQVRRRDGHDSRFPAADTPRLGRACLGGRRLVRYQQIDKPLQCVLRYHNLTPYPDRAARSSNSPSPPSKSTTPARLSSSHHRCLAGESRRTVRTLAFDGGSITDDQPLTCRPDCRKGTVVLRSVSRTQADAGPETSGPDRKSLPRRAITTATSAALRYRCSGRLARSLRTTADNPRGTSGRYHSTVGGGSTLCLNNFSTTESAGKGMRPVSR